MNWKSLALFAGIFGLGVFAFVPGVSAALLSYVGALIHLATPMGVTTPFAVIPGTMTYALPTVFEDSGNGTMTPGVAYTTLGGSVSNPAGSTTAHLEMSIQQNLTDGSANALTCDVEFASASAVFTGAGVAPVSLTTPTCSVVGSGVVYDFGSVTIPADTGGVNSTYSVSITPDVRIPTGPVYASGGFQ